MSETGEFALLNLLERSGFAGPFGATRVLAALLSLALLAGCVARPCACSVAASASQKPNLGTTPAPCQATASAPNADRPAAFARQPALIWDGEEPDARARGWASCEEKESCAASLTAKPGVGRNGSTGLEFVVKGKKWAGFGWNWFGWWPDSAGTDISAYKSLRFWLRVSAEAGKKKPPPDTLRVSLHGSSKGGKDATAPVTVGDYAPSFLDGEWHEIVMPLEPLLRGEGETFDSEKTWEIDFGAWTMEECEYTLALDEIAFL